MMSKKIKIDLMGNFSFMNMSGFDLISTNLFCLLAVLWSRGWLRSWRSYLLSSFYWSTLLSTCSRGFTSEGLLIKSEVLLVSRRNLEQHTSRQQKPWRCLSPCSRSNGGPSPCMELGNSSRMTCRLLSTYLLLCLPTLVGVWTLSCL